MRGFCQENLKKKNINFSIKQTNFSFNEKNFTLRGFHYQNYPFSENKVVTCVKGKILLVLVNIDFLGDFCYNHSQIVSLSFIFIQCIK